MGLGSWLSDAFSGLGSLAKNVATTIGREATDFTGALVGGTYGALTGKEVELPALTGLSTAAEAIGGALGTSIGGGVGRAIVERAVAAGPIGTSGVEAQPQTRPQGSTLEQMLTRWGVPTTWGGGQPVKSTALPGGAPVQAGIGETMLGLAVEAGKAITGWEGVFPEVGRWLGLAEGEMANGNGALTLPGAAPGTIYRITNQRLVPRRNFVIPNPSTGRYDWFAPMGRPLLFESDFAACRRVERVARKCRRFVRKR